MRRLWPATLAALLLLSTIALAPAPAAGASPPAAVRPATGNGWPTYHHDNSRQGADPTIPTFLAQASGAWSVNSLDENVFASPVVWNGMVYVATENDTVYALDEVTGATVWSTHFASPIPGNSTYIGCSPTQFGAHNGVTGTPAVDPSTGIVYVVGTQDLGGGTTGSAKYTLFGLNGSTGAVIGSITTDLPGPIVAYQNQRGALAVAGGRVYIPFGGRDGDCGTYHPYVLSVSTSGGSLLTYQPQTAGQNEAGIWAPSGEAVDAAGNVYVETGNGSYGSSTPCDNTKWDHGNAVIKLSPTLSQLGFFAPANWCNLSASDTDLGSVAPLLMPGNEVLASGKSGWAWLLNSGAMPSFGAPQQQGLISGCGNGDGVYGGMAFGDPYAYVPCDNDGVVALNVNTSGGTYAQAWTAHAPGGGNFNPGAPILAGGTLWVEPQYGGSVYGYNPATGGLTFNIGLSAGAHRFTTLAADGDRLFAMLTKGVESLRFTTPVSFTPVMTAYFPWFDRMSSPQFTSDNIHVINPNPTDAYVNVTIPGLPTCSVMGDTVPAGKERVYTCATGFGGPVTVQASQRVLTSQRVKFGSTFNEVPGLVTPSTSLYLPWYDLASDPGFVQDNIHVVNPSNAVQDATVTIPGCGAITRALAAGAESVFSCPGGFGGPVKITGNTTGVLASQRVRFYNSFNEEPALAASAGGTGEWLGWYDLASDPAFLGDNIHVVNPDPAVDAVTSVTIPGCGTQVATVAHGGGERLFTCAGGFGGPVRITTNGSHVLATARVRYGQTFNEVTAQATGAALPTVYLSWYDVVSDPAFRDDNVHVVNPGTSPSTAAVTIPGCGTQTLPVNAASEAIFSCPNGFGGPVVVQASGPPLLASQRVRYGQSFNEVNGQG